MSGFVCAQLPLKAPVNDNKISLKSKFDARSKFKRTISNTISCITEILSIIKMAQLSTIKSGWQIKNQINIMIRAKMIPKMQVTKTIE